MSLVAIGLNHRTAPLDLLERMTIVDADLPKALHALQTRPHINEAWNELRKAAGIPDAHLHDLRHTYATALASSGLSLPVIGALLGHTTAQTTLRYSHLMDDPLRAATERASAIITGKAPADVLPLTKRGRR